MAKSCEISRGFLQCSLSFFLSPSLLLSLSSSLPSLLLFLRIRISRSNSCFPPALCRRTWNMKGSQKITCLLQMEKMLRILLEDLLPFNIFMYLFSTQLFRPSIGSTRQKVPTWFQQLSFLLSL